MVQHPSSFCGEETSSKSTKIPEKGSTCAAIRAVFSGFRGWLTGTERNNQCAAPYTCHTEKAKHRCQSEDSATGKTLNSPNSRARAHTVSDLMWVTKKRERRSVFWLFALHNLLRNKGRKNTKEKKTSQTIKSEAKNQAKKFNLSQFFFSTFRMCKTR